MLLLSKLKVVAGGSLLLAAVVAAGWACLAGGAAHAGAPGDEVAPRGQDEARSPARTGRATNPPIEPREAEFVFRGAARGGQTVSLVVAGTSAPVLCLPVKNDLRVLVGGRPVGIDELRPGSRVLIRLDATNSVIRDIRALERRGTVTVLTSARDLARFDAPPGEDEVLRALPPVPRAVPGVFEVFRDDIQVVAERLVKSVDPPRVFPLVGEAKLHHSAWKCTVYYTETVESSYPHPARTQRAGVEVVYLDRDFLVPAR